MPEAVVVGLEPDTGVPAVGRPAPGGGQGEVGQGDGVDNPGSYPPGPAGGQGDPGWGGVAGYQNLR